MQNLPIKLALITLTWCSTMTHAKQNNITIYSGNHQGHLNQHQLQNVNNIPGYAVVRQSQQAQFDSGLFTLVFEDVAAHIDPTTVSFTTPENPSAAAVLEQNFQFDLVGSDKLLEKYIDQPIKVVYGTGDDSQSVTGTLLSTQGGITLLRQDQSIMTLQSWDRIDFPELPGGLRTKPALVWLLQSTSDQAEQINVSYQTQGMTWWADYNITLREDNQQCTMDLSSWVSIVNKAGASFPNTQLKLIAGDVNRSQPTLMHSKSRNQVTAMAAESFSEQPLFEYHLYQLPRTVDLPDNSTKQIQLMDPARNIRCQKQLIFNGSGQSGFKHNRPLTDASYTGSPMSPVEVLLKFKNSDDNQLGSPLPAGRVRVNTLNPNDQNLEFIGEDSIRHTPKNSEVLLKLGQSFDVKGQRVQKDFTLIKNGLVEQIAITITNQKSQPAKVTVTEPLYRWSNWTITQHDEEYRKPDASTIEFDLMVPAETSKTIAYTVQYNWPENK